MYVILLVAKVLGHFPLKPMYIFLERGGSLTGFCNFPIKVDSIVLMFGPNCLNEMRDPTRTLNVFSCGKNVYITYIAYRMCKECIINSQSLCKIVKST